MIYNIKKCWLLVSISLWFCSYSHSSSLSTTHEPLIVEVTATTQESSDELATQEIVDKTLSNYQEKDTNLNSSIAPGLLNVSSNLENADAPKSFEALADFPEGPVPLSIPGELSGKQQEESQEPPKPISKEETMPSFDEWKKMMLADEKGGKEASPTQGSILPKKNIPGQHRRNYASYECGAKIVATNPEADNPNHMLNEQVDEYMLSLCKVKIWFVVELCEAIQSSQIELANFELFSSTPKEFTVSWSDNYPSRDWTSLGTFIALDQRSVHTFPTNQGGFGKYMKVEFLSHYGSQHYCPISLIRVYGTSMVDQYVEMEKDVGSSSSHEMEDDKLEMEQKSSSDLFGSAKEAVMKLVNTVLTLDTKNNIVMNETTTSPPPVEQQTQSTPEPDNMTTQVPLSLYCTDVCPAEQDATHTRLPTDPQICRFFEAARGLNKEEKFSSTFISSTHPSPIVTSSMFEGGVKLEIKPSKTVETKEAADLNSSSIESSKVLTITETTTAPKPQSPELNTNPVIDATVSSSAVTSILPPVVNATPVLNLENIDTTYDVDPNATLESPPPDSLVLDGDVKKDNKKDPVQTKQDQIQKESVFVRMANRIKALELNMSLSSRYLQELSQRYRKQMEEMLDKFDNAINAINKSLKKVIEDDQRQQEAINRLQIREVNLTETISTLLQQQEVYNSFVYKGFLIFLSLHIVTLVALYKLYTRPKVIHSSLPLPMNGSTPTQPNTPVRSIQLQKVCPLQRCSSQVILPAKQIQSLLVQPTPEEPPPNKSKKKKKKGKGMKKSHSNPTLVTNERTIETSQPNNNNTSTGLNSSSQTNITTTPPTTTNSNNIKPSPLQNVTNHLLTSHLPLFLSDKCQNSSNKRKFKSHRNPSV